MSSHIFIATPCYGGQLTMAYVKSVLDFQAEAAKRGIRTSFRFVANEALIVRARNELTWAFLQSDATHLLFIDADIGFVPEQVFRLLAFDADVTAAAYPLKKIDWEKVRRAAQSGRPDLEGAGLDYVLYPETKGAMTARNDFVRVRHTGTGFLMIRRAALVKMCAAYPQLRYKPARYEADLLKDGP